MSSSAQPETATAGEDRPASHTDTNGSSSPSPPSTDPPPLHHLPEQGAGPPLTAPVTQQGRRHAGLLQASKPPPMYVCANCGIQLALQDEIVSKSFSGRSSKAYLFHTLLNCSIGAAEERQLLTGLHTVADVSCGCCSVVVGWTYLRAFEASQKYKEGRFILEEERVHKVNHWE